MRHKIISRASRDNYLVFELLLTEDEVDVLTKLWQKQRSIDETTPQSLEYFARDLVSKFIKEKSANANV